MSSFLYKKSKLYCEAIAVDEICSSVETPFYLYSTKSIIDNYRKLSTSLKKTNCLIAYAAKANSNLSILKILANCGAGADVVSLGELNRALKVGIPSSKIVYSGVGKKEQEIARAINEKIFQFNVESYEEMKNIGAIAEQKKIKANIALRVNPDVSAGGHPKISTGKKSDKFGVSIEKAIEAYNYAKEHNFINIVGIDMHIGSQILDVKPFKKAFAKIVSLTKKLERIGFNFLNIDLGGGIGINYLESNKKDLLTEYTSLIKDVYKKTGKKIIIEPGRYLVGDSGILVTKIIYTKKNEDKNFLIVDAGMNDFLRPALYSAKHLVKTLKKNKRSNKCVNYDVVGPICETADTIANDVTFTGKTEKGDYLFIEKVGAYGSVMASNYNSRDTIEELLVSGKKYEVIRKKINAYDLMRNERFATWLK